MITHIEIENYKSLHKLSLEVGRFNVLIGENGCGKSNLLEALTLVAAADANKLDNEFLSSRGIRVTEPHLMRSAFDEENQSKPIKITIGSDGQDSSKEYVLTHDNEPYSQWAREGALERISIDLTDEKREILKSLISDENWYEDDGSMQGVHGNREEFIKFLASIESSNAKQFASLSNFVIYSPENTALRNFYKEGQIEPLGINGEGLLKLLKTLHKSTASKSGKTYKKKDAQSLSKVDEIQATLQLFDWYEGLEVPQDLSESEDKVTIRDRYLNDTFDQRSTNEGFLFVLFYIALMVSDDTPKVFAIDNIDASLNPKLCTKLISELTRLAKKYNKQVFVTTHNPAILDGIDLGDEEQRLLVVSRNKQGHTRCKRMTFVNKPKSSSGEPLKLSEAFLRGYLGGLPKGF